MAPDYEHLQSSLDDVAATVEWAAGWIEYLEENEVRVGTSDLAILQAELRRLQVVADSLVPGRVRDPASGRRWYLAPDEVTARELLLQRALDSSAKDVERVTAETYEQRDQEKREDEERDEARARRDQQQRQREDTEQAAVEAFLHEHGASTLAEIKRGTGLSEFAAERAAKAVAKRRTDKRFELTPTK